MQPPSRRKVWPPSRNVRFVLSQYDRFQKVGAKGFFLILMAISWIPSCGYSSNIAIRITTELIEDVMWLMSEMLDAVGGLSDVVVSLKDATSNKRKASSGGRPAKRAKSSK